MLVTLQPPTPFDQSVIWRIHDAYFAARGIDAWNQGEVPYYSTSNFATARQHAGFFADLVMSQLLEGRLDDDAPIWILEVGAGLGRFASNFLRALETAAGPLGEDLFDRVRYVISDYSERSLRGALGTAGLKAHVEAGRVVPALFDLREPDRLRMLDPGRLLGRSDLPPLGDEVAGVGAAAFQLVIANYVCCVVPLKNLQHAAGAGWYEQWVSVEKKVEAGDQREAAEILASLLAEPTREGLLKAVDMHLEWRERPLEEVYPNPLHQRVLTELVSGLDDATVGYPHGFIEFVDAVARFLAPGGLVMVNDYGSVAKADLRGLSERRSQIYGNSIANAINFSVFDAFAEVTGWQLLRTRDPLDSLHTALLRPSIPFSEREASGFHRNYVASRGGDDILDYSHSARLYAEKKDWDRAVRYWKRCIELEPENPEHFYRAGEAAIDGGFFELAVKYLEQGLELQTSDQVLDFEFQLGRATCMAQDSKAAIGWYERALLKENHPTTWTNLGVLYESDGRLADAFRCYRRAMELDPRYGRARDRMKILKDMVWRRKLEEFDGPDTEDPLAYPGPEEEAAAGAPEEEASGEMPEAPDDEDNAEEV